jgi:nicotinamidase-related amidase
MPDSALLVIDMQPALMTGAHDHAGVLDRVAALAGRARWAGVPVVYLRQRIDVTGDAADVDPAVAPRPGDVVLDKDSADSFLGTTLDDVLAEHAVQRVVVTGYATEYCVDSTARSALSHGYDLTLVADGHSTPDRPDGVVPSAAQIIGHHNVTFGIIQYAGRTITVVPADEIRFGTG